jgi:uncharacterized membrane protein (UPF0136 family)
MAALAAASCGNPNHSHDDHSHNNSSPTKTTTTLEKFGLERDNISVFINTVAACLLLGGGIIGYLKKGSKVSIAVSFLFAVCWLLCAHLLTKNTGREIEKRLVHIRKRSEALALFQGMFQEEVLNAQRTVFRAHAAAVISSLALIVLMALRVVVVQVEFSTPIMASMATGLVVLLFNAQRMLLRSEH